MAAVLSGAFLSILVVLGDEHLVLFLGAFSDGFLHYFDIVGHSWIWLEIFGHSCYGCFLAAAPPGVLFGVLLVLGEEHLVVSQCFLAECCTYTDIVGYSWRMPSSFSFLCSPWYSSW